MTATLTPPRITLNSEIKPQEELAPREFVAEITIDEFRPVPENYGGGFQWAFGVRPLDGFVKGKTGMFHEFISVKGEPAANNKLGQTLSSLQDVFPDEDFPIGEGALKGRIAVFTRFTKTWGKKDNGEEIKGTITLAVRAATDDDLRKYGRLAKNESSAFEWTPELVEAAVSVMDGTTKANHKVKVINAQELDPNARQLLLKGTGVQYLIDNGVLAFDGKTYNRA